MAVYPFKRLSKKIAQRSEAARTNYKVNRLANKGHQPVTGETERGESGSLLEFGDWVKLSVKRGGCIEAFG